MLYSYKATLYEQPTFVSDGCTSGGHCSICGELYKQVTSSAEHTLVGQVLHLIGVIHRGRIYVVAILNQQPKTYRDKEIKMESCYLSVWF